MSAENSGEACLSEQVTRGQGSAVVLDLSPERHHEASTSGSDFRKFRKLVVLEVQFAQARRRLRCCRGLLQPPPRCISAFWFREGRHGCDFFTQSSIFPWLRG